MNVVDTYKFVWNELKKYNRTKAREKRKDKRIIREQQINEFWNSEKKHIIMKNHLISLKEKACNLKNTIIFRVKSFPVYYSFLCVLMFYFIYIFGHNALRLRIYNEIDLLLDKSNAYKVIFVVIYVISAIIVLYSRPSETTVHLNKVREKIVLLSNVKKEMGQFEKLKVYALLIAMKICDCDIDHIKQEAQRFKDINPIKVVLNIIKWAIGMIISGVPIKIILQLIEENNDVMIDGYILIILISAVVCLILIIVRLSLIIKKDIYKSSIDYVIDYCSSSVYNRMEFPEEELNKYYKVAFKYYFGQ